MPNANQASRAAAGCAYRSSPPVSPAGSRRCRDKAGTCRAVLMLAGHQVRLARSRCPVSKTSSFRQHAHIRDRPPWSAGAGRVDEDREPMLRLPMSRLQMSGRLDHGARGLPDPAACWQDRACLVGSRGSCSKAGAGPVVRLIRTSVPLARMRSTTSRDRARHPCWAWWSADCAHGYGTTAAPALAASIEDLATAPA